MNSRFISNVVLGLGGVIVVVASQAFASGVTGWVMFGISLSALALLPLVQRDRVRGRAQGVLTWSPERLRRGRPSPPSSSPAAR